MAIYNFKKVGSKRVVVWNRGRLRGLKEANERIGDLPKEVNRLLCTKKRIKVLEVGCGYGRILLELKKIFGDKIETHGINLEPRWNKNLVKRFALANKIFTKKEVNKNLPKIHILDAGKKLPFKRDSFDLIFAQATVQYINDKALFLEEVNRLLTKKGISFIELQEFKRKHPQEYKNLFEVWDDCKLINSISYLRKFKNIKIKKMRLRDWHVLIIRKGKKFKLNLKLNRAFDLNKICKKWWGSKAIYVLGKKV